MGAAAEAEAHRGGAAAALKGHLVRAGPVQQAGQEHRAAAGAAGAVEGPHLGSQGLEALAVVAAGAVEAAEAEDPGRPEAAALRLASGGHRAALAWQARPGCRAAAAEAAAEAAPGVR